MTFFKKCPYRGSPGLVVIGWDWQCEGCGFESQHRILDGHLSHKFVVQILLMFVWKDQKNEKNAGDGPFKKVSLLSRLVLKPGQTVLYHCAESKLKRVKKLEKFQQQQQLGEVGQMGDRLKNWKAKITYFIYLGGKKKREKESDRRQ